MGEDCRSEAFAVNLLNELEHILACDPLIDEVGFIHPSQIAMLNEESSVSSPSTQCSTEQSAADSKISPNDSALASGNMNFWCRDHKLGISTQILLPLYKAARNAFLESMRQFQMLDEFAKETTDVNVEFHSSSSFATLECDIMKHSKALLLLSCDLGTAWNSRKLILKRKKNPALFIDELLLSALVLSFSPKSDSAWCHRRWVIKMIAGRCPDLPEIVEKESELVEKIAEKSKMNYRAWNHRSWLVSYMRREQVINELQKSRTWAGLHVADSSCFHYRRRLMSKILERCGSKQNDSASGYNDEVYRLWQEELEWDEKLIKRYVGREALWLHRRFLALCWIRQFAGFLTGVLNQNDHQISVSGDIGMFLNKELHLVKSCMNIPDNLFEDFQAQAVHSVTYILWLIKEFPEFQSSEFREKLEAEDLKYLLKTICPERSFRWIN